MSSSTLTIATPRAFTPLLGSARYKGAYGGRGSGKSHFFAERLVEECVAEPTTRAVCVREIQRSLEQSVKTLIGDKIAKLGVGRHFEIHDKEIHVLDAKGARRGLIIFQGMQNHTADSIKSLEGYRIAWVEEAQSLSQRSLDLLTPTLRVAGAEIWFSWNPRRPTDPVDAFMRGAEPGDPDIACVAVNYHDNPLLSFVFNVGTGPAWTIWKRLRTRQFDQVPLELMKFVNVGGRKVRGLVARRAEECKLWATGEPGTTARRVPSSVSRANPTPPTPADPHPPQRSVQILTLAGTAAATTTAAVGQVSQTLAPYAAASDLVRQLVSALAVVAAMAATMGLILAWAKTREARG